MKNEIRILLVDDDPVLRELSAEELLLEGYPVDTAGDGIAALEKIHANNYSLLIIDLLMPGMNGIETINKVRESHPEMKIILVSAVHKIEGLNESGLDEHVVNLAKPYNVDDLNAVISRIFNQS